MGRLACMVAISGLGLAFVVGCGAGDEGSSPEVAKSDPTPAASVPADTAEAGSPAAGEEAATIFSTRCFTCHGEKGAGDGPGSAGLSPTPRNFQDADWQGSVDDEHIGNIILYGGAAVGRSPMMPGNPDLIAKPEVVTALVQHIRTLAPR